ncbi:hypothetical protein K3495_g2012 [Podosphaera aphanis]|nr:hypothetical protein K3495_g2012 [Podosphaera aphanis]
MDVKNTEQRTLTPPATLIDEQSISKITQGTSVSSTESLTPKSVAFELLFTESPQQRARIPMRVQIYPHDTTESIVTTVKNFYGLYPGPNGVKGVSFEDQEGNTLIARYENFRNNMVVYVRVIDEKLPSVGSNSSSSLQNETSDQQIFYPAEANHMPPPETSQILNCGRPSSRTSRKRSTSPNQNHGRRSTSTYSNLPPTTKSRSRSGNKSRGSSVHSSFPDDPSDNLSSYANEDGNAGSYMTRTKSEHIGSTEISLDNIVEGGRRKRAKFESSELPLFAPPQMPAATSNSSVSPARRIEHARSVLYTQSSSQYPFSSMQPLQSPQSFNNGLAAQAAFYSTPGAKNRRTRGEFSNHQSINSTPSCNGSSIIPTPDPTVGSCMSEEDKDVAMQLIRLGELSNIPHTRNSASTLDDNLSGHADAASSTGATSCCDSESETEFASTNRVKREPSLVLPTSLVHKFNSNLGDNLLGQDSTEQSCDDVDYEDRCDETFNPGPKGKSINNIVQAKKVSAKTKNQLNSVGKARGNNLTAKPKPNRSKNQRSTNSKTKKTSSTHKPISPASLPSQSRKTSNASTLNLPQLLGEEEDLSSKPRCQRCRKSKKGCDRQRPCQRCKDAGLSADQCVSEDEGNGRKGRYGRHMGVSVKKDAKSTQVSSQLSVNASGGQISPNKKRKR